MSPEYVLLGFLYKQSGYGYELHQRLVNDFGNIWHASQSQTYNILKRLESQGHIFSRLIEQKKLPSRQLLSITDSGIEKFDDWLHQPTNPSVHAIRVEFVTRLYFMQQYYPQNSEKMIRNQIDVVRRGISDLEQSFSDISPDQTYSRLALQLRIKLLNSVLSWLYECLSMFGIKQSVE